MKKSNNLTERIYIEMLLECHNSWRLVNVEMKKISKLKCVTIHYHDDKLNKNRTFFLVNRTIIAVAYSYCEGIDIFGKAW